MTQSPVVSICIPAFNAAATLGATLNSLVGQHYPHIEIIVSDNHSTDTTKDIIQSYAVHQVRYCKPDLAPDRFLGRPYYQGGYVNANYVLKQGRGDLLCLFHADDVYEPDIVSKQVAFMQTYPQVGTIFTALRTIGSDGQPIRMGEWRLPQELRGQQVFDFTAIFNAILVHGNFLYTPTVMLRRNVFDSVGDFDEELFGTSSDLEMFLRIAQHFPIGIIDEPLLNYRISPKQGGAQYNRLRTTPADFFTVIDHFLAQPAVQSLTTSQALAGYEFQCSVDQIVRATNLLVQGRSAEAQPLLHDAVQPKHFATALQRRSKRLLRLITGAGLLGSSRLGLGTQAAHMLQRAEQRRQERLHASLR